MPNVSPFLIFGIAFMSQPAPTPDPDWLADTLGVAFRVHRTRHFAVVSDAPAALLRTYERSLERSHAQVTAWAAQLKLTTSPITDPLVVVVFDHWVDYRQYAHRRGFDPDARVPGFYSPKTRLCVLFNYGESSPIREKRREVERLRSENQAGAARPPSTQTAQDPLASRIAAMESEIATYRRRVEQTVIRHEAAHQTLDALALTPHEQVNEPWLREGMATQFEADLPDNPLRRRDFLAAEGEGRAISVRALILEPAAFDPSSAGAARAYAAAWALVHYLTLQKPAEFTALLRSRLAHSTADPLSPQSALAEFEAAFGKTDAAFDRRLADHVRRLGAPPTSQPS